MADVLRVLLSDSSQACVGNYTVMCSECSCQTVVRHVWVTTL